MSYEIKNHKNVGSNGKMLFSALLFLNCFSIATLAMVSSDGGHAPDTAGQPQPPAVVAVKTAIAPPAGQLQSITRARATELLADIATEGAVARYANFHNDLHGSCFSKHCSKERFYERASLAAKGTAIVLTWLSGGLGFAGVSTGVPQALAFAAGGVTTIDLAWFQPCLTAAKGASTSLTGFIDNEVINDFTSNLDAAGKHMLQKMAENILNAAASNAGLI